MAERKTTLSVWDGVRAFFGGCGFIVTTPRVWGYAIFPVFVALLLVSAFAALGIWGGIHAANAIVDADSTWASAARVTLQIVFGIMAVLFALLIAFALSQPLSGFALEAIVRQQERALGSSRTWPEQPFGPTLVRSLSVNLTSLALGLPLLVVLTVVELFAPPAAVVTIPLKFFVSAFMVAWDFLDYPLGIRSAGVRDRFKFVGKHLGAVLAFGLLGALVLLVPGLGLLLLPMGAAGATRMVLEAEVRARA